MLVSFEVEKYGPFRDRTTLSLPLPKATNAPNATTPLGHCLPFVTMPFGPNASGKTSLLDSIVALSTAVEQSHRTWDPGGGTNARPFPLQPGSHEPATTWRVRFITTDQDGEPGQYEYSVTLSSAAVMEEGLRFKSAATRRYEHSVHQKWPTGHVTI